MIFNLGDVVEYTNKKYKADMIGYIIAYEGSYVCVETLSGDSGCTQEKSWFWKNEQSDYLSDRFEQLGFASGYTSKSDKCQWIPKRSRNLKQAIREYDPTQAGDTDEDI